MQIDAVITWVDGSDPSHVQKLKFFLEKHGIEPREAASPTRFNDSGEIEYCLRAILHFAPWIRRIHIVTDQQTPKIIQKLQDRSCLNKINLVDHREIFKGYEHCLPTFNSISIESMLWRIPELAEHFIYFNDDCFLLRPVLPTDFFRDDMPILRGFWKKQIDKQWQAYLRPIWPKKISLHRSTQEHAAQLAGEQRYFFHLHHVPFPLKKTAFEQFFRSHPDLLEENIRHQLRHKTQFMPMSLIYHALIKQKAAILEHRHQEIMIHAALHTMRKIKARLKCAVKDSRILFACIQSLDEATFDRSQQLHAWLKQRIPE